MAVTACAPGRSVLRGAALAAVAASLGAAACSDPVTPPALGAAYWFISSSLTPPAGKSCASAGKTGQVQAGATPLTAASTRGVLVSDGDGGAKVRCSVARSGVVEEGGKNYTKYSASGSVKKGSYSFYFSGEFIEGGSASDPQIAGSVRGTGTGSVGFFTPDSLGMESDEARPCTFDVIDVAGGKVWASFACDGLVKSDEPQVYCGVLENSGSVFAFADCES
ncbi:MAG: hypothetical protein IT376_08040 [Polyangiaceae bacterium]|nr:hypothetical protein [Polyangiaceae bacterium]